MPVFHINCLLLVCLFVYWYQHSRNFDVAFSQLRRNV